MHYDSDNAPKPIIKLIVYKHGTCDEEDPGFYYDITSIQEIRYVSTYAVASLHFQTQYLFEDALKDAAEERWYLVELDSLGYDKFAVSSFVDVTDDDNENYKLH